MDGEGTVNLMPESMDSRTPTATTLATFPVVKHTVRGTLLPLVLCTNYY